MSRKEMVQIKCKHRYPASIAAAITILLLRNFIMIQKAVIKDVNSVRYHYRAARHGITMKGEHYLGKAFIISVDKFCPADAISAAKESGFYPILLDAVQPNTTHFSNYSAFLDFCFDGENVTKPSEMSAGEIALVGSHRVALQHIANDPDLRDDDWSVILESDARLHPNATLKARALIEKAIDYHNQDKNGYGFMYLGACAPNCKRIIGSVGHNCQGHCTHALAFTKERAKTFFHELYCMKGSEDAPCGWMCEKKICVIDGMMRKFFSKQKSPSISLVGYDFVSPDSGSHRGLMYQKRTTNLIGIGTSLKLIEFSPTLPEASQDSRCFRTRFTGRLGNLMFEYAALVGACVKHGLQPETCAGFSMGDLHRHNLLLPTRKLRDIFAIPIVSCSTNASLSYQEHADSIYAIKYDADLLKQPPGTSFEGYMQSYKYFHHARSDIQRLYSFPKDVILRTQAFFADIRRESRSGHPPEIACISIRRGDKTRKNERSVYNHWSLSTDYYRKALNILRQRNRSLTFVYSTGGGTNPRMVAEDRQWVIDTFITPNGEETSFLEPEDFTAADSLHMMTECDSLVVSASSFSWWAGYLSKKDGTIIAPKHIQENFVPEDYYPPWWTLIDKD